MKRSRYDITASPTVSYYGKGSYYRPLWMDSVLGDSIDMSVLVGGVVVVWNEV